MTSKPSKPTKPNKPKKPNTKDTTVAGVPARPVSRSNTGAPYTFKRGDFVVFDNMAGLEATGVVVFGPTEGGTPPGMVAVWTGEVECSRYNATKVKHVLYELSVDMVKKLETIDCTTYGGQYHE